MSDADKEIAKAMAELESLTGDGVKKTDKKQSQAPIHYREVNIDKHVNLPKKALPPKEKDEKDNTDENKSEVEIEQEQKKEEEHNEEEDQKKEKH